MAGSDQQADMVLGDDPDDEVPACYHCGTTAGITLGAEPFGVAVLGDDTLVWLCAECRRLSRERIPAERG